jgi:hypothetical protein
LVVSGELGTVPHALKGVNEPQELRPCPRPRQLAEAGGRAILRPVERLAAATLGALAQLYNPLTAFVLAAFWALASRAAILLTLGRKRGAVVVLPQLLVASCFVALGGLYGLFTAHMLVWNLAAVTAVVLAVVLAGLSLALERRRGRERRLPSPTALLARAVVVLALLLLASLTLMRAGFVALTEDRSVLLVEVTGEIRTQRVRWAAPGRPVEERDLVAHRVVFKAADAVVLSEAWVYGDQVALKGRVLRLSPLLNAAGVPNLFEIQFAHNGYLTLERHNTQPHEAFPLPRLGPLAVHPWWSPLQRRLLEAWESGTTEGSSWGVKSVTTESTFFPLVGTLGNPITQTHRLVLTPGGLSSS